MGISALSITHDTIPLAQFIFIDKPSVANHCLMALDVLTTLMTFFLDICLSNIDTYNRNENIKRRGSERVF